MKLQLKTLTAGATLPLIMLTLLVGCTNAKEKDPSAAKAAAPAAPAAPATPETKEDKKDPNVDCKLEQIKKSALLLKGYKRDSQCAVTPTTPESPKDEGGAGGTTTGSGNPTAPSTGGNGSNGGGAGAGTPGATPEKDAKTEGPQKEDPLATLKDEKLKKVALETMKSDRVEQIGQPGKFFFVKTLTVKIGEATAQSKNVIYFQVFDVNVDCGAPKGFNIVHESWTKENDIKKVDQWIFGLDQEGTPKMVAHRVLHITDADGVKFIVDERESDSTKQDKDGKEVAVPKIDPAKIQEKKVELIEALFKSLP